MLHFLKRKKINWDFTEKFHHFWNGKYGISINWIKIQESLSSKCQVTKRFFIKNKLL